MFSYKSFGVFGRLVSLQLDLLKIVMQACPKLRSRTKRFHFYQ